MKTIILSTAALSVALTLTGCSDKKPTPSLAGGATIGYGHISKSTGKLDKITSYDSKSDTHELIRIKKHGFAPNYSVPSEEAHCKTSGFSNSKRNHAICSSLFGYTDAGNAAQAVASNALITAFTFGANALTGVSTYDVEFDYDKFNEVIKTSGIEHAAEKLRALYAKAEQSRAQLQDYDAKLHKAYNDTLSGANFDYQLVDASGLYPQKNVDPQCRVNSTARPVAIDIKAFTGELMTDADFVAARNSIDQKSSALRSKIGDGYNEASINCRISSLLKYNDNISFKLKVENPKRVSSDTLRSPIKIKTIVESADLTGMIPKQYTIDDAIIKADFKAEKTEKNLFVAFPNIKNTTRSFINIDSITNYYAGSVLSNQDLNEEISPEAQYTPSVYIVFGNTNHAAKTDYLAMTAEKVKKIKIDYGYAIKYRVLDTNKEKTLYKTEKFELQDILKEYI